MVKEMNYDYDYDYELAREFEEFKAQHKYSVLMAKMIVYYETIMQDEILLPFDTPEKRAEDCVRELYNRDKDEFNKVYEIAWNEIADQMD